MKKAEDTTIEDALRHMQDKEDVIFGFAKDRTVAIGGRILSPARSQAVYNHSPDGFAWGYGGSGPAQLALAILLEFTDQETALRLYQDFKWALIANLNRGSNFCVPISVVKQWIKNACAQTLK